jgi:hypothetical protein
LPCRASRQPRRAWLSLWRRGRSVTASRWSLPSKSRCRVNPRGVRATRTSPLRQRLPRRTRRPKASRRQTPPAPSTDRAPQSRRPYSAHGGVEDTWGTSYVESSTRSVRPRTEDSGPVIRKSLGIYQERVAKLLNVLVRDDRGAT